MRAGVDVGGTFTDLAAVAGGRLVTAKVPSTPADQSEGVAAVLDAARLGPLEVLAHGTTVATNTLLERSGARTALVTTEGFRDVIEIGRQARAALYDLARHNPPPLVARDDRFTVRERVGPGGVVVPLDEASVLDAVAAVRDSGADAVAVCLLFSFLDDTHERAVGAALARELPGLHVSLSCDVLPEFREYERTATTVANAYVAPRLAAYLERLDARGLGRLLVMQSSGGVVDAHAAAALPGACVLSGPAGGVVGAAAAARASGFENVLTLDMGGTSADVAAIVGGRAPVRTETIVGGVPLRFPSVDVHTVGAGGGSIAWLDEGGALRVGPRSAGALPGPACYGRGGTEPTVTDAHLVLGHLPERLGGVRLDRGLAERALGDLPPEGILRVADAEMARALRVVSVERGLDPRDFALLAFGGAGPLHACSLAEELGIRTVLVPAAAGVLSALGLALSDLRRDYVGAPAHGFEPLERRALDDLPGARIERRVDARYRGQAFELTVDAERWQERFHDEHELRYGYRVDAEPEIVSVRVTAIAETSAPELPRGDRRGAVDAAGTIELDGATVLVREGWSGGFDDYGTLILERR